MSRAKELHHIANTIGFTYHHSVDKLPGDILEKDFFLFTSFHFHKEQDLVSRFTNILAGRSDIFSLWCADFKNSAVLNQNVFGHGQTIAVLRCDHFDLQKFYLIPKRAQRFTVSLEHIGNDYILPWFKGLKRMKFTGFPCLADNYILWLEQEEKFQQLFPVSFSQYLEQGSKWFIEGNGNSLIIYHRWKKVEPSAMDQFIQDVVEIGEKLAQT